MSIDAILRTIVREEVAAALAAAAEPTKKGSKKSQAAEPAPPAAPAVAAPAPVAAPAEAEAAPAPAPVFPPIEKVNAAVLALAGINRPKAKEILGKFGVAATPELKKEQYQAVIDAMEEAKAAIDAAAAQASLV